MPGSGQASTAKDPGLYSVVSAVLLRQDIRCDLARSKDTVQRPSDPAVLGDALIALGPRVLPACLHLAERQLVGSVAVDLIRAHQDEDSARATATAGFEQVQCAGRVHIKVV